MTAEQITPLRRLADLVTQRRLELHMDKIDIARAANVTITTYSKIESGYPVRDSTYAKVDHVLGWAVGSCQGVLDGFEPAAIEARGEGAVAYRSPLPDEIKQAVQDASLAVTDDLTAAQIREISAKVIDLLHSRGLLPADK